MNIIHTLRSFHAIRHERRNTYFNKRSSSRYLRKDFKREGRLNTDVLATTLTVNFVEKAIAFIYKEIRHELAGVETDRTKNVGVTSTVKMLLFSNEHENKHLLNAWWVAPNNSMLTVDQTLGDINFCIPLCSYDSSNTTHELL